MRNIQPAVMTDKLEEWRRWRSKVAVYFEHTTPGMKLLLEKIQKMEEWEENFAKEETALTAKSWVSEDNPKIYRALQELTGGEALRVVEAVGGEDGYKAWFELHRHFEPSLKGRQGQAYNDLGDTIRHRAKDVSETCRMVTELITRIKLTEDLTGEKISPGHARTVLLGFIDDVTRQHTIDYHGTDESFEEFKNAVVRFANNATLGSATSRATPMQIGAVAGHAPLFAAETWAPPGLPGAGGE